ncbi:helix-turn-helix transcriptional regulator [Eggerthellaceae bacterium zg-997]|nr:helix-turn-helix transcriptional regulator [Eggerthellaceae bacterium zg-997]
MKVAFYLYTIAVMLACVSAGTMALSAYLICRRRTYVYALAFFAGYFLDLVLIFQYEYLGLTYESFEALYYRIDMPLLKMALSLVALQSLWMISREHFGVRGRASLAAPAAAFVALSLATAYGLAETAFRQWAYYGLRQVFLGGMVVFWLWSYHALPDSAEKVRLARYRRFVIAAGVVVACIFIEDTLVIFFMSPDSSLLPDAFPVYLSGRNFSENLFALSLAALCLRSAGHRLGLRFNEPIRVDGDARRAYVDDMLPSFGARHGLSPRELEVLELIIDGSDNQNIASALHLAVGTVKAHVHNIMRKTDCANREELVRAFWAE